MRSRANMEIGNYAAAIEAYEKYLELKPEDREALKGIAIAYEKQGLTDKAIIRYDKYLEVFQDDADVAFKQADYLGWSRYAYRKDDAVKYLKMGLEIRDEPVQRLRLARLLAADKYDLDEAVRQYEWLIRRDPYDNTLRTEYRDILLWDDRFIDRAIKEFQRYVDVNPHDFNARKQLAELLAKAGQDAQSGRIYTQLVKEKPEDLALRHDYALVLARMPDRHQQAAEQYRMIIAEKPDYETLSEAAGLLESRAETRVEAIELYSRMIEQRPQDINPRLRRAALYMQNKSTAESALQDYRRVLARQPDNAKAHRGVAQALAWQEQSDEALYHAELAEKYSRGDAGASSLTSQLSKGREPRLTALLELPMHTGSSDFELDGLRIGARFESDITPFTGWYGELGSERFDGPDEDNSGIWWRLGGQYRPDLNHSINFEIGDRAVREVGDTQTVHVSYTERAGDGGWDYTAGYGKSLVEDSYLSLVGDSLSDLGGATRDEFYIYFENDRNDNRMTFRPSIGWIDSKAESANNYLSISGSMDYLTGLITVLQTHFGVAVTYSTYEKDHSGFGASVTEPLSGGYFSPETYLDLYLYADFDSDSGGGSEWQARIGPRLQYVDDASADGETSSGFSGSISYNRKQTDSRYLILIAEHESIGDRYRRNFLQAQMVFLF